MMISVIVPVYNVEKYIENCIRSIVNQTERDFELILVDDGSPDASAGIAEALLRRERGICYSIIHTENQGVSAARNTGLLAANGEYVIMVDADDVLSPSFLADYRMLMKRNPGCNLYSSHFVIVNEQTSLAFADGGNSAVYEISAADAQKRFLDRSIKFLLPTLMIRRDFLKENHIRFDNQVRYSEDVQFMWRCIAYNQKTILHTTKPNYHYVLHDGSTMTASGLSKIETGFSGLERLYQEIGGLLIEEIRDTFYQMSKFALLHGAAHILSFQDIMTLYRRYSLGKAFQALMSRGILPVRVLSLLMLISPGIGYQILKKF